MTGPADGRRSPEATPVSAPRRPLERLTGIDAARGVALIAIMCVHLLPRTYPSTGTPTLTWIFFPGDSPALFALLAGTGIAVMDSEHATIKEIFFEQVKAS